jgi:hypothetical protein
MVRRIKEVYDYNNTSIKYFAMAERQMFVNECLLSHSQPRNMASGLHIQLIRYPWLLTNNYRYRLDNHSYCPVSIVIDENPRYRAITIVIVNNYGHRIDNYGYRRKL